MANSKLIIVEGPQGAGKTTITDYIRHKIPYTNLYRLNGSNDSSPSRKSKIRRNVYRPIRLHRKASKQKHKSFI